MTYSLIFAWLIIIATITFLTLSATGFQFRMWIPFRFPVCTFLVNTLSSIVAALLLASFFFLIRERIDPLPDVGGLWYCESLTRKTTERAYYNRKFRYEVIILQKLDIIQGTFEKILDHSYNETVHLIGKDRVRGEIEGYLHDKFLLFGRDRLFLHVIEGNNGEKSTHFYGMCIESGRAMVGEFESMVAGQSGKIECQRENFGYWEKTLTSKNTCPDIFLNRGRVRQ